MIGLPSILPVVGNHLHLLITLRVFFDLSHRPGWLKHFKVLEGWAAYAAPERAQAADARSWGIDALGLAHADYLGVSAVL